MCTDAAAARASSSSQRSRARHRRSSASRRRSSTRGSLVALTHLFGRVGGVAERRGDGAVGGPGVPGAGSSPARDVGEPADRRVVAGAGPRSRRVPAPGGVSAWSGCVSLADSALAAMVEPSVLAPVLSQPSVPFPFRTARKADINLSPADPPWSGSGSRRAARSWGCGSPATWRSGTGSTPAARARRGSSPWSSQGRRHSVLTEHRQEAGVRSVPRLSPRAARLPA